MTAPPEGLIVVSGASTGIGAATAREFASRGYHVLAGVRRDQYADAPRAHRPAAAFTLPLGRLARSTH